MQSDANNLSGPTKAKHEIATSTDGNFVIIQDDYAPPVPWMTRRDLYEWVWTQPVAYVSEMLGLTMSVGWLCWIYDVQRPPAGHFNKLRAGNRTERMSLSVGRDPLEPVPIVNFHRESNGRYKARVRLPLLPTAQLGAPTASGAVYPRVGEQLALVAAPVAGCVNQLVRLSSIALGGPPEAMTLGLLHRLIWRMPNDELANWLGLYGLTPEEIAELASLGEGVGTLAPRNEWDKPGAEPFARRHAKAKPKRLSSKQKCQTVDLSPTRRAAITEQAERTRLEIERRHQERSNRQREHYESRRHNIAVIRKSLPQVFRYTSQGVDVFEAAEALGLAPKHLGQAMAEATKDSTDSKIGQWIRVIGAVLKRGRSLDGREIVMLADIFSTKDDEMLRWRDAYSHRYRSSATTLDARVGLAEWLHAAGDSLDAIATVEAALEECRASMPRECLVSARERFDRRNDGFAGDVDKGARA